MNYSFVISRILAESPAVKSLFRFKPVCKFRHQLFSHQHTISRSNDAALKNPTSALFNNDASLKNPTSVLFREPCYSKNTFVRVDSSGCSSEFNLGYLKKDSVEKEEEDPIVVVRASCNGLLCCTTNTNRDAYYVCNPVTREFKLLPNIGEETLASLRAAGETDPFYFVGFAVDPRTERYNVVLADSGPIIRHRLNCLVFDSETNEWKRVVSSGRNKFCQMRRDKVVSIGLSIYWLPSTWEDISVLDLYNEAGKKISLPGEMNKCTGGYFMSEFEGSLSVIHILGEWMNIWVLKDNLGQGEEWILADRVSLVRFGEEFIESSCPIAQNSDFIFLETPEHMLVYCRGNELWKEVYYVRNKPLFPLVPTAFAFRSTLCSC